MNEWVDLPDGKKRMSLDALLRTQVRESFEFLSEEDALITLSEDGKQTITEAMLANDVWSSIFDLFHDAVRDEVRAFLKGRQG